MAVTTANCLSRLLLPFLDSIPPHRAAEMALKIAEEVDAFLLTVPDEVVAAAWRVLTARTWIGFASGGPYRPD